MFITYHVMSARKSEELEKRFSLDELAIMFEDPKTTSFERNKIYATVFCNLFRLYLLL